MSKYLLEIGVEELPYKFINNACEQLKEGFSKLFEAEELTYNSIETFATPRRLVVLVEGLIEKQPDITKSIKGPPAKIAYNSDGSLSQAGLGFLKKQGITEKDIEKISENGVDYILAKVEQKGQNTKDVLQKEIPSLILKLQGPYFMRWADLDIKFSRPIRWLVSLMDNQEISISIENVHSSRQSRGHRFSQNKEVTVTSIEAYFDIMKKANVIVKQIERKALVLEFLEKKASEVDGIIKPDAELLDEIANILEWPVPVLCSFSEDYLKIPDDVTVTVMKSHQRYFPVYSKSGELTNYFITMANFVGNEFDNIRVGNERVIKARLEDGKFFYDEDLKKKLSDRVEDLKGITFQKGLGTMYDKCQRLVELSGFLAESLGKSDEKASIQRTALLCKADLLTNLVYEFTELEGFIGADYALQTGETQAVAEGIKEHYFPLGADSEVAKGIEGQVVGIVDKIDTIVTTFAVGKKPTGSADPLGIRRATLGVISTILQNDLKVDISKVIEKAISIAPIKIEDEKALLKDIEEFFIGRLKIMLQQNYKYDLIEAVCAVGNPLSDICDLKIRLKVLTEIYNKHLEFKNIHENFTRIIKFVEKATNIEEPQEPDEQASYEEKKLYEYTNIISSRVLPKEGGMSKHYGYKTENWYKHLYKWLFFDSELAKTVLNSEIETFEKYPELISKFIDKVYVSENPNRINILAKVKEHSEVIADFSKIVL